MAKTYLGTGNASASTANTTDYRPLGGASTPSTTEANKQTKFRTAGTLTGLYVRISANTIAGTSTIRTRKNTANGNMSVSIGSSATGEFLEGSPSSDSISSTDLICYQFVPGAATNTLTPSIISTLFQATTNTVTVLVLNNNQNMTTASTTWYQALGGHHNSLQTTETFQKCRLRKAGTLKNYGVYVSANRAQTTTVRIRKNGVNGNGTISITGGAGAGWFEDTSSTDTVSAGEDWNWSTTTGTGSDTLTIQQYKCEFESTNGDGICIVSAPLGVNFTDNTTRYTWLSGQLTNQTNETGATGVVADVREAFTFSDLEVMISANTATVTSTITLRKNAGDVTELIASVTADGTGLFSDESGTNTFSSVTDEVNYEITVPAESGTNNLTVVSIIVHTNAATANNVTKTLEETVTISEASLTRLGAKIRTGGTETVTITEAAMTRLAAKTRALSTETVTVTPTVDKSRGRPRSPATETVTVGESIARLAAKTRALATETTTIGESLTRLCNKIRSLATETVTSNGGAATFVKGKLRTLEENVTVAEASLARMCAKIRTNIETVIIGESPTRLAAKTRSLATETVTSDGGTVARLKGAMRSLATETVTIGESLNRLSAKTRALATETVTISEASLTRLCAKIRALATQVVAIADNVAITVGGVNNVHRIIEETVTIGENLARMCAKIRTGSDTTSIGESVARLAAKTRSLATETVTVGGGTIARLAAKIRTNIENVISSEQLTRLSNHFRTIIETVTSSEQLTRIKGVNKSLSDNITIGAGTVARLCAKIRNPIETVVSTEQLTRLSQHFRTLIETVVSSDIVTALKQGPISAHRILEETVVVSDNLDRFVSHIAQRFGGGGAGGRKLKRLKRYDFKIWD